MNNIMMKDKGSQTGSTLMIVLLVLASVTSLGVMAIMTGDTEQDVAANDKFHKMAFNSADSACEMTSELIEQNIEERGFSTGTWGNGKVGIKKSNFYMNEESFDDPGTSDIDESLWNRPTETSQDIEIPDIGNGVAYVNTYANTALSTGSAIEIAAGYEGTAKGLAGGGGQMVFEIRSLADGPVDSQARVWLRWRHLM
jgi:Tfp pilus assembly protein PilX